MHYYYWHYGVEYDAWKCLWGVFFGFLYLVSIVAFARHVRQSPQGTIYNWPACVVLFLAMGLVILAIFIIQV